MMLRVCASHCTIYLIQMYDVCCFCAAGNPEAKGVFFPNGVMGAINSPAGYNVTASGLDSFPASNAFVTTQVCCCTLSCVLTQFLLYCVCMS